MRTRGSGARDSVLGARYLVLSALLVVVGYGHPVFAAERYALVVTGASGGEDYARKYDGWRESFVKILHDSLGYPADHIVVLAEQASGTTRVATRENVRAGLHDLETKTAKDDLVLVLLVGHGSAADEDAAKFNLVGPDLTIDEWAALLRPIPAKLVFVDTASGSFPFLRRLAGRGRIVLTANDSAAQTFETVFPEFFIQAFDAGAADLDKNGRVSVWEAFVYASDRVAQWFEQKGQLATERPLLDDTGAGIGREAGMDGRDGTQAQVTYLQADRPIADTGDAELTALVRRRAQLDTELEELRARKASLAPAEYDEALEKLLVEIAQLDRTIRATSK
jgi:hypothetical protein